MDIYELKNRLGVYRLSNKVLTKLGYFLEHKEIYLWKGPKCFIH